MDRRYRIKVWKDRMAGVYPAKWCWEVIERASSGKVIGCGTTFDKSKSHEAAERVVAMREADLQERLSARGLDRLAWANAGELALRSSF